MPSNPQENNASSTSALPLEGLLRLLNVPQIGPTRFRALIEAFKAPDAVFAASLPELCRVDGVSLAIAKQIRNADSGRFVEEQLARVKKSNCRAISYWDDEYPVNLKHIYDPPVILFMRGEFRPEDDAAIAVVGTRRPTAYGAAVTREIASGLAKEGVTVVSGLAYGIDSIGHTAALEAGGRSIAVLGSGVDIIYPSKNANLAKRLESQGAICSEFPMGSKPEAEHFPQRNRVISGISLATVVVEAGAQSGALITASYALDQNRDVLAVPGQVTSPKSEGTHRLIRQGAALARSADDVLDEISARLRRKRKKPQMEIDFHFSPEEKRILACLEAAPRHIDDIAEECKMTTSRALAALLQLELKSVVVQQAGKIFTRVL